MTELPQRMGLAEPPPIPPSVAELMWPEIPGLTESIFAEIRSRIPEYARSEEHYQRVIHFAIEELLKAFVKKVANPAETYDDRDHLCRRLGQFEFHEGRSLDILQGAFRTGLRLCWHRVVQVASGQGVSPETLTVMAECALKYMDEVADLSVAGFQEAQAQSSDELELQRRKLLEMIVQEPPSSPEAINEQANLTGWKIPDEVTMIAIRSGAPVVLRTLLDRELLMDFNCAQPHLLMPGPVTDHEKAMLEAVLAGASGCIGVTVPLARAAASLRWARRTLSLADNGLIPDSKPFFRCEDQHLMELWLLNDVELVEQLGRRRLSALDNVETWKRQRLIETLMVWLVTKGTAVQMGERLNVHPQTVRYRLRRLEEVFGEALDDPDNRFCLEVVLRSMWLLKRQTPDDDLATGEPPDADPIE